MQKLLVRGLFLALFFSAAESWALPTCPDTDDSTWTNCVGTKTFASGNQYVGDGRMANSMGKAPRPMPMEELRKGYGKRMSFYMPKRLLQRMPLQKLPLLPLQMTEIRPCSVRHWFCSNPFRTYCYQQSRHQWM